MGIFSNIVSSLFHHAQSAEQVAAADTPAATGAPAVSAAPDTPAPSPATSSTAAPASGGAASGSSAQTVDAKAVLAGLAAKNPQTLDWQHSIVDMMKLLGLDPSLENRKELAKELHYTGDTADTAKMNTWLHGEVMKKLSENGGQVPADLKA